MLKEILGYLTIFIIRSRASKVEMGFEAEVRELFFSEPATLDTPFIKGKNWRLFTDMYEDEEHEPEFSTIGGLDRVSAVKAAEEIQETLLKIINRVNGAAKHLASYKSFAYLLDKTYGKISQINQCFEDKVVLSPEELIYHPNFIKIYSCVMERTEDEYHASKIVDGAINYDSKEGKDAKEFYDIVLEPYLDKTPSSTELIEDSRVKEKCESLKGDKERLKSVVVNFFCRKFMAKKLRDVIDEYIALLISSEQDLINEAKKDVEEQYNIQGVDDDNEYEKELLQETIDYFNESEGKISYEFGFMDTDLGVESAFRAFCFLPTDDKTVSLYDSGSLERYQVCPFNNVYTGFQLSYSFKLGSFVNLIKFYSTYSKDLTSKSNNELLDSKYIPVTMVKISDCLFNGNSCLDVPYLNRNYHFDALWKNKRLVIQKLIESYYDGSKKLIDAEGFFYLVLSYTLQIFNRSEYDSHSDLQQYDLDYGPKKSLSIMSRVSFSELYENLGAEKSMFTDLVSELCDYDFGNNEYRISSDPKENYCDKMLLVEYGIIENSEGFEEQFKESVPLTLIDWIKSIIGTGEQIADQPKLDIKDGAMVSRPWSDKLSPPSGFIIEGKKAGNLHESTTQKEDVYGMGAYTNIESGYLLAELRPYSSLEIPVDKIKAFISGHASILYHLLGIEERIEEFVYYQDWLDQMVKENHSSSDTIKKQDFESSLDSQLII